MQAFTSLNTMASSFLVKKNKSRVQHTVQNADALDFSTVMQPTATGHHPMPARLRNVAFHLAASHLSCKLVADPSGNWCLSSAAGAART